MEILTHCVEAVPHLGKSAARIAEFIMENIVYQYVVPKSILHDQTTEFRNAFNICARNL